MLLVKITLKDTETQNDILLIETKRSLNTPV